MTSDSANAQKLAARIRDANAAGSKRIPVDCGHYDIRIDRDGTWYYRDSPIRRKPLVTLFSSVLKRDHDGLYWLETPVERGQIDVVDAPFVAVALQTSGSGDAQTLIFHTNLDESVTADREHPIWVESNVATGEPSPYIHVRGGLNALIARPVYYELVELTTEDKDDPAVLGVWSAGEFFVLGRAEDDDSA